MHAATCIPCTLSMCIPIVLAVYNMQHLQYGAAAIRVCVSTYTPSQALSILQLCM
jgi:hypothetical protein